MIRHRDPRRRFGLAWCDNSEGQHEVYFQSFDERGKPLAPIRRLTFNASDSLIPAITSSDEGFALAWNEYTPGKADVRPGEEGRSEIAFAMVH